MAKRYILFAGDRYYPEGGAYDLIDFFDSVQEAVNHFQTELGIQIDSPWANIYDLQKKEVTISFHEYDGWVDGDWRYNY